MTWKGSIVLDAPEPRSLVLPPQEKHPGVFRGNKNGNLPEPAYPVPSSPSAFATVLLPVPTMAPALLPALMMLTTAVFQSSNQQHCDNMLPELIGVFVGPDDWVDDDSSVAVCDPAYAAFTEGPSCSYHWLESCSDGEFSIEDSYSYSIQTYECTGPAEGFTYDVENTTGEHSCNYFKRSGDTLTYIYGNKADSLEGTVCPNPEGLIGADETIAGSFTGKLSAADDSADAADFACK